MRNKKIIFPSGGYVVIREENVKSSDYIQLKPNQPKKVVIDFYNKNGTFVTNYQNEILFEAIVKRTDPEFADFLRKYFEKKELKEISK